MDRVNGWAEVLQRLGDVEGNIPARLFIHRRCGRLVETLPSLQHDPSRPEDVLKVDADGEGVGRDDAADALGIWWRRKRLEAGNYALSGLGWLRGRYSQGVALGYRMAPRWGDNIEGVLSRGVAPGYRRAPRWGEGAAMPDGEPMLLRTMGRLVRGGWRRCRGDCPRLARGTKTCRERSRRLGFGIGRGSGGRQKHPENVGGGVGIAVGRKEVCE